QVLGTDQVDSESGSVKIAPQSALRGFPPHRAHAEEKSGGRSSTEQSIRSLAVDNNARLKARILLDTHQGGYCSHGMACKRNVGSIQLAEERAAHLRIQTLQLTQNKLQVL